jgi:hypothetical protein
MTYNQGMDRLIVERSKLEMLTPEEADLMWQMYVEECYHSHVKASLSDFYIWMEERE